MNNKLRITAIILVLCCTCLICHAQQQNHTVSFSYDLDGNRIEREILIQRMDHKGESAMTQATATAKDFFKTTTIGLYPNPTSDRFMVEIIGGENGMVVTAQLTDVSGMVLTERAINNPLESFDISKLASGIYFLRLTVENETHVWKIIKN